MEAQSAARPEQHTRPEDTSNDEAVAQALQEVEYDEEIAPTWQWHADADQWESAMDIDDQEAEQATTGVSSVVWQEWPASSSAATSSSSRSTALGEEPQCCICLDSEQHEWTWLQCAHKFHNECLEEWLRTERRCPVCRTEVSEE